MTTNGDQPVPKVIDFGIAKATQGRLTDKTLFTHFRQFIGTPEKLTRQIQTLRPEAFLVWNLANEENLNLVLESDLSNLSPAISTHWSAAQAIREERQQPTKEHPMPTTNRQLCHPDLLDNMGQMMAKIVEMAAKGN